MKEIEKITLSVAKLLLKHPGKPLVPPSIENRRKTAKSSTKPLKKRREIPISR
jgi:hypothetical protein